MAFPLMMDHHVHSAVTRGVRLRGVDVLTALEDGSDTRPDDDLLRRSTELGRVLFSQDSDLIREARAFMERGERFAGVIYAHQLQVTIGICVRDLSDLAAHLESDDMTNQLLFLPV